MFTYSSSEDILPSLVFTKAELLYALTVLMADIPPSDNHTKIELVEVRHYLNQIREVVSKAASDGTLERAVAASKPEEGKDAAPVPKAAPAPSMSELRAKFPTLTEEEIREVIAKARETREKEERERRERNPPPPPPPSFIAKPRETQPVQKPLTPKQEKDRENSVKFAELLGTF